jgi:hypothetical protein
MKRISISIGVFLVAFTTTFAQFQINSMNLAFSGGWSLMNIEESSNSVNGFEIGGHFEHTSINGKWAFGAALSFVRVTDDVGSDRALYSSTPFTFQTKYLFGSLDTKGFIKANLGIHSSKVEWNGTRRDIKNWDHGFVVGGGAGVNQYLSQTVYIIVAYDIKWLQNSYYNNGLLHTFSAGLGFQFQ